MAQWTDEELRIAALVAKGLDGSMAPKPKGTARQRIVMEKAVGPGGAIKGKSGLVLKGSKTNPAMKRWQKANPDQAKPKQPGAQEEQGDQQAGGSHLAGESVTFRNPKTGAEGKGQIVAHGEKGATIEGEDGGTYKVEHGHYSRQHPTEADAEGQEGGQGEQEQGQGSAKGAGASYEAAKGAGASTGDSGPDLTPDPAKANHVEPIQLSNGKTGELAFDKEGKPARIWVDHAEGLPAQTDKAFKGEDGWYQPERRALHVEIINRAFEGKDDVPEGQKPIALVMMGGPASGKSTGMKEVFDKKVLEGFVGVDPDAVKVQLPEFNQALEAGEEHGLPVTAKDAAWMVHEESSDVAAMIHDRAVQEKKHLILDGTGKSLDKMKAKIDRLKSQGYHVQLMMVDLDKDVAYDRMRARAVGSGRYVPDPVFHEAHDKIPGNFEPLANMADEAWNIKNDGDPSKGIGPTMMYERSQATGGKPKIHNPEKWESFNERAARSRAAFQGGSGRGDGGSGQGSSGGKGSASGDEDGRRVAGQAGRGMARKGPDAAGSGGGDGGKPKAGAGQRRGVMEKAAPVNKAWRYQTEPPPAAQSVDEAHLALGHGPLGAAQSAPHYRKAEGREPPCSTCRFAMNGHCLPYGFDYDPGFTCDSWVAQDFKDETSAHSLAKQVNEAVRVALARVRRLIRELGEVGVEADMEKAVTAGSVVVPQDLEGSPDVDAMMKRARVHGWLDTDEDTDDDTDEE